MQRYKNETFEDIGDIAICDARKDEKNILWKRVKAELVKEGKINVSNRRKTISKKRASKIVGSRCHRIDT